MRLEALLIAAGLAVATAGNAVASPNDSSAACAVRAASSFQPSTITNDPLADQEPVAQPASTVRGQPNRPGYRKE